MPCRVDGPYTDDEVRSIAESNARKAYTTMKRVADTLTKENDELRELVLKLAKNPDTQIPASVMNKITKAQVAHRKEDLARLEKTFTKAKDAKRLEKVWDADPTKELEPQLGFNPDKF